MPCPEDPAHLWKEREAGGPCRRESLLGGQGGRKDSAH